MTGPRPLTTIALLLPLAMVAARTAAAGPYPVNACVARKQKAAGKYCAAVLQAAAKPDRKHGRATGDAAKLLAAKWAEAEAKARAKGTDCADTTLSASAAQAEIDAATDQIVAAVGGGTAGGDASGRKCAQPVLSAASEACDELLAAEGEHVKDLAKDADGAARSAALLRAVRKLARGFANPRKHGCVPADSQTRVATLVDGIRAGIVRDTTISPNVDDTQFTTYSPVGPIGYAGREFTPVCMDGSPYHYFAKRGSVNKLVVYYQGGGACWDSLTCSVPSCDPTVDPGDNPGLDHSGFADLTNPLNPFRDWNIVFVAYCSCDIHFGDAAQDYPPHVEHRGYENARVVEKWAREHFVEPDRVFVTGSSAGAYGAWFHAPLLHQVWPASHFDVLADAGNGVVTQEFLDQFFPNWNFAANVPDDIPGLRDVLVNGSGIPGYTEVVANFFPHTRWAHYATAYDGGSGGQTGFYNIMLHHNNPIFALTWWMGSCAFNAQMRAQAIATAAAIPSNYRYYIGTGSRHTMWGSNKVYGDTTGGVPTIVDWIDAMLGGTPAWTNVECTNCGLTLPGDPVPDPVRRPFKQVGSDIVVDCSGSPSGAFLDGDPPG